MPTVMAVGVASPSAQGAGYDEYCQRGEKSVRETVSLVEDTPCDETYYGYEDYYRYEN